MNNNKYNYIFYNICEDYFNPIFSELSKFPFAKVFTRAFNSNPLLQKLFFIHWSAKLNRRINLPFKNIWFKKMCQHKFPDNKPVCYVFLGGKYLNQDDRLFKYIKKLNPDNKCVIIYLDLASKNKPKVERLKLLSDLIITYDKGEAEKLDISYLDIDYYTPLIEVTEPESFLYDVCFLGFAKDRLNEIHKAYNFFTKQGLKCKFIVCGTKEEDRISGEGLIYSPPVSYMENLKIVNSSKCILELIQGNSVAPTLRLREAKTYKRKLITNNQNEEYLKSLDKSNLCVFKDIEEIDTGFVKSEINYSAFDENYSSPIKLVEYLEDTL